MQIDVAEIFYSLQGEGTTRGTPAIFIRLVGCNLTCGVQSNICEASKATWVCDSYKLWHEKTLSFSNEQLLDYIADLVGLESIKNRTVHLVWTGGEPCLPKNEEMIISFLTFLGDKGIFPFSEMETNGTILPSEQLLSRLNLINCSPKLSNSGIKDSIRINKDFLARATMKFYFKFVVTEEKHWAEIEKDFLPHIRKSSIILMPGMDHLGEDTMKISQSVWNLAQREKVLFSTREQITVWNKLTGI